MFRWFNKIETGEALFTPQDPSNSPFQRYVESGDIDVIRKVIEPLEPLITGAYITRTPKGLTKKQAIPALIDKAWKSSFLLDNDGEVFLRGLSNHFPKGRCLKDLFEYFYRIPYIGMFFGGQLVADLKFSSVWRDAEDWETFAVPGTGSMAGLNLITGRALRATWVRKLWHQQLLAFRETYLTPAFSAARFPIPDAQDTQNILCEFSKYRRGYSRTKYRGSHLQQVPNPI